MSEVSTQPVAVQLWSPQQQQQQQQQQLPVQQVQRGFLAKLRAVDVLSSALPLLLVAKLLGLVTCRVYSRVTTSRPGAVYSSVTLATSRLGAVYSLVIVAALGYVTWYMFQIVINDTIEQSRFFILLMHFIYEYPSVLAACFVLNGLRQNQFVRFFEDLHQIDKSMENMNIQVHHKTNQRFAIAYTTAALLAIIYHILINLRHYRLTAMMWFASTCPHLLLYIWEALFVCSVLNLRHRFRRLNEYLRSQGHGADVAGVASLHAELCNVAAAVNGVHSRLILIAVPSCLYQILHYMVVLNQTIKFQDVAWLNCVSVILITAARVVLVCLVSDLTGQESVRTREEVNRIILKTSGGGAEEELKLISLMLMKKKTSFSAAGVFTLDMQFVFSMVSAVAVYFALYTKTLQGN